MSLVEQYKILKEFPKSRPECRVNLDKVLSLLPLAFYFKEGGKLGGLRKIFKEILLHGAKIRKTVMWIVGFQHNVGDLQSITVTSGDYATA